MYLSDLQKYILKNIWSDNKSRVNRDQFVDYYKQITDPPQKNMRTKIVTQSIERLIDRGLLVGFGERTRYKWFIKHVKLTSKGRRVAKKLMGQQTKLPFKK